jgi:hypothetical protein
MRRCQANTSSCNAMEVESLPSASQVGDQQASSSHPSVSQLRNDIIPCNENVPATDSSGLKSSVNNTAGGRKTPGFAIKIKLFRTASERDVFSWYSWMIRRWCRAKHPEFFNITGISTNRNWILNENRSNLCRKFRQGPLAMCHTNRRAFSSCVKRKLWIVMASPSVGTPETNVEKLRELLKDVGTQLKASLELLLCILTHVVLYRKFIYNDGTATVIRHCQKHHTKERCELKRHTKDLQDLRRPGHASVDVSPAWICTPRCPPGVLLLSNGVHSHMDGSSLCAVESNKLNLQL